MTTADLHPSTHLRAAAWVPDDVEDRPWEEAIALAADWIWERSQDEGLPPMVVSNAQKTGGLGYPDLDEIIRAGGHTTPKSRTRFDRGPVLAFVPGEQSLHLAMGLARGYSLAVVEGSQLPLTEWAAGAAAVNLLTGQTNGWTGPDEKAQVRRYLSDHINSGRLTPDQAASYALSSQSVSDRGAKKLRDLLSR